jgi:DNA-directed RNA polymerase subunit RPC12/RpoP
MTNKRPPHKRCSTCKEMKYFKDFSKHKGRPDGHHPQCRECRSKYKRSPESLAKSRQKTREWNRLKLTGFTPEDFENKLAEQNYKCAICGTEDPGATNWHADHDHKTEQKRGILCHKCNTGLGLLKDDIDILCSAIEYLNHYSK